MGLSTRQVPAHAFELASRSGAARGAHVLEQWTEIDLSSVPSLEMARYKRAYLNEGKGCCKDDPERAACRSNKHTR